MLVLLYYDLVARMIVHLDRDGAAAFSLSQNGERRLKNVGPKAVVTSRTISALPQ